MEERLNWMDEHYLSKYDETVIDSAIPKQKAFDTVKELTMEYPVSENEPEEENSYLSYNIVAGNSLDVEQNTAFDILDYALVSAPGAPLKQALIDAGSVQRSQADMTVERCSRHFCDCKKYQSAGKRAFSGCHP